MITLLIATYCQLALNQSTCEQRLDDCINRLNNLKYIESMWLDIPDEKMSMESFHECTKIIELKKR